MTFGAPKLKPPDTWAVDAVVFETRPRDKFDGPWVVVRTQLFSSHAQEWEVSCHRTEAEAKAEAAQWQCFWGLSGGQLAVLVGMPPGVLVKLPAWATFALAGHEASGLEVMPVGWPFALTENGRAGIYINAEVHPGNRSTVETFKVGP